ncbi:pitrilysin family protein [Ferruginibacter sp. HRS2-29]|uniref:M16 family metallopeptidase n=1 Tax=Ferruginibacter sp. HRS2-29 TaxID=2487334 RepID=UPI0020CF0E4C|nr:pitrilysin family protein [Ferruginibacter sp. HRS2-29]MCP9750636.1 insulinase family protein [Ferruginibacter sp. HRS2-29]
MNKLFNAAKWSFFLLAVTGTQYAAAQKAPAYEMNVEGVKVIVQPSGNDIVDIQTVIKGGVQNYPLNKQGIERLAFSGLTECGTLNDDKNSFKNKLDKVTAYIYGNSGMDFSSVNMNCIKSDLDVVWPLYTDAITKPAFDQKEFDRMKQDAINSLKSQASQPDYAISKLAKETAFKGKDYAKSPEGTEATVKTLTAAETKAYYQSILTKSRMVIVVVADIEKEALTRMLTQLLTPIPQGKPFVLKKQLYKPVKSTFASQKSDLATNYIQGITSAPEPGTPDFNAFSLAMRIFYDRHFLDVRSKNGLSYAPATWFDGGASPSANLFVSTTEPDKYIAVANALIEKIKKEGFTEAELKDMKTTYLTGFYYRQETNGAQANSFVANEVLHGNWKRALTMNDDMKNVTVKDLDNVFNKYITNITWAYRGNTSKVNPKLYTGDNKVVTKLPPAKINPQKRN